MMRGTVRHRPVEGKVLHRGRRSALVLTLLAVLLASQLAASLVPYEVPGPLRKLLYPDPLFPEPDDGGIGEGGLPFSRVPMNDTLWVMDLRGAGDTRRLTAVSLQGLANRDISTLFIIHSDLDLEWLGRLCNRTGCIVNNCTLETAVGMFSDRLEGAVLFDGGDDLSVNEATTICGIRDAIMVSKGGSTFGLDVLDDVTDTAGMSDVDLCMKYSAMCNRQVIANLDHHDIESRDYVIQNRMLCLGLEPGPLSSPVENMRLSVIAEDFSRGGSGADRWVFGWFNAPTYTEEDYCIQALSHHGVILLPCTDVPNLSVLQSADGSGEETARPQAEGAPTGQQAVGETPGPGAANEPKNAVYVTFGYADGDNLNMMYNGMMGFWDEPGRGNYPVAWSVSPVATVMAPILMDRFGNGSSPRDTLIAGGSGMGIIFPDFFDPDKLDTYLDASSSLGMDHAWLLNSYSPFETRYSDRVMDAYAGRYDGLVLDYGCAPVKDNAWSRSDCPMVRSVHYMGDDGDLRAKLTERSTRTDEPLFLFITLYPWADLDMGRITGILEDVHGGCTYVDLPAFFDLVEGSGLRLDYPEETRTHIAARDTQGGIANPWGLGNTFLAVAALLTIALWVLSEHIRRRIRLPLGWPDGRGVLFTTLATGMFLSGLIWSSYQNYWQWTWLLLIPLAVLVHPVAFGTGGAPGKARHLEVAALLGISAPLVTHSPAFMLAGAVGLYYVVRSHPSVFVKTFPLAIPLAICLSMLQWTVWVPLVAGVLLCLEAYRLAGEDHHGCGDADEKGDGVGVYEDNERDETRDKGRWTRAMAYLRDIPFTLLPALLLTTCLFPMYYLELPTINARMGFDGTAIILASILIPLASIPLAWTLQRFHRTLLVTFPVTWLMLLISFQPLMTFIALALVQAQAFALSGRYFDRWIIGPGPQSRRADFARNMTALPVLMGIGLLIPPMFHTVYLVSLPDVLLYVMYLLPVGAFIFFTAVCMALYIVTGEKLDQTAKCQRHF